jgi:WD40 repeat protein
MLFADRHLGGGIFDANDGGVLREFRGRGKGYSIAFSPDGQRLACVRSNSRDVELLEIESGQRLGLLPHAASVTCIAWSPNGRSVVCACTDGLAYVWDTETVEQRLRLEGHDWTVAVCAFNSAGNLIATTSYDDTTRLWDADTGRLLLTIPAGIYQLQFAPDDRHLSFVPTTGRNAWLALRTGNALTTWAPPQRMGGIHWLSFSADGRWLATLSEAELYIWDYHRRRLVYREPVREGRRVLFSPREAKLLVVARKGVYLRGYTTNELSEDQLSPGEMSVLATNFGWVNATFSADGAWIALANNSTKEATVLRSDGRGTPIVLGPHAGVSTVALSPDGRTLAKSPFIGPPVHVWDVPSRRLIKELATGPKCDANFSPDGRWLLTVGDRAQLWDATSWTEVRRPDLDQHTINAGHGAFSPDGRWIAVTDKNRIMHLLQFPECRRVGVLEGPNQPGIFGMQFNPARDELAAICSYGPIQVWDLAEVRRSLMELDLGLPAFQR